MHYCNYCNYCINIAIIALVLQLLQWIIAVLSYVIVVIVIIIIVIDVDVKHVIGSHGCNKYKTKKTGNWKTIGTNKSWFKFWNFLHFSLSQTHEITVNKS